jgi:ABC-type amino acid transport substrate-binding protein
VIALKKGSALLEEVNEALATIKAEGEFNRLRRQWLDIIFETEVHDAS